MSGPLALTTRMQGRWLALCAGIALAICFALCTGTALAATDWDGDGYADNDCAPLDPAVHPGAVDKPDLNFEDTNCDGIDGDLAKAVFVSASAANNAGPGSKENPVRDLSFAIAKASSEGKDVYAITGTYDQGSVALEDNVGIYGGYILGTGVRTTSETTLIKGAPQAVLGDGDTGVVLQLLTLQASADGGRSAYGARFINGSSAVLQKVTATAGNGVAGPNGGNGGPGKPGEDGTVGSNGACTVWTGSSGPRAAGGAGGDSFVFVFPTFVNQPGFDGGTGGFGGAFNNPATAGGTGLGPDGQTGGPAPANANGNSGNAGTSAPATPPAAAAGGANATFPAATTDSAWTGASGAAGATGADGSGGGGGSGGAVRSDTSSTGGYTDAGGGGGGGGGEGGAGGAGGGAGAGGGGSFGVFAQNSGVVVENSALTAGNGGNGGNGGTGGTGGARGLGKLGGSGAFCDDGDGASETGGSGGPGGNGQPGGTGGAGGGGAGGPSYGIYVAGTGSFVSKDTTVTTGTPGTGGHRGGTTTNAASGQAAPASQAGSSSSDFDGDGIADASDACPDVAGGSADANGDGCPDRPAKLADANGNGIPDSAEASSNTSSNTGTAPPSGGGSGAPAVTAPTPRVAAKVVAAFKMTKASTTVTKLVVSALRSGDKVKLTCSGKGCAFKSKAVKTVAGKANMLKLFSKRALAPKAVVMVWITRPGAIGQVVKFTMGKGKAPKRTNMCMPAGKSKAQASC